MANWKDIRNFMETGNNTPLIPEGMEVVPVVGVTFVKGYPKNIQGLVTSPFVEVQLIRNPKNPYDKNAVEVHFEDAMLGHLPREVAARVAVVMDEGGSYLATIYRVRISPENPNNPGLDLLLDKDK